MPAPLATEEQLELFLQGDGPDPVDVDSDVATLLLGIASAEVRAATGQLFDFVEDDELILNGNGTFCLLLPELPVVEVSEVAERVRGVSWDDATILDGPDGDAQHPDYEWAEDGRLRRLRGHRWNDRLRWYRVTYSHGFTTYPDEVVGVVLAAAARAIGNPEGLRSETIGRYSYTKAGQEAGVGLFASDLELLAAYTFDPRARAGTAAAGS